VVTDILNEAWKWFKDRVFEIVETVVDAVLGFVGKIVGAIDGALEFLWRNLAKPVLQTIFPILWRIFSFPVDVLEFILGKVYDLLMYLYGLVDTLIHEVEVKIFDITVSAVRSVYDFVSTMFVNVYNAVRSLYVGLRDVTSGFILSTVRRIRERLHTIITVDLWILGCWRAFQGSLEGFSFGDFLKTAVLCLMAPVASGYIAGIITSLTPTPGTEFPGFVPSLEFPEIRVEDMPRFSVVTPPPIMFPTVGVSALPFAVVMDLGARYEVAGVPVITFAPSVGLSVGYSVVVVGYVLSDSVGVSLSDLWSYSVAVVGYVLSDSVSIGLSDVWSYGVGRVFGFNDSVGLGLIDSWSYGLAGVLGLSDSCGLSLTDGWSYFVRYDLGLSDGAGLGLFDAWSVLLDEILLVRFAGFDVSYPAVVDMNDVVVSTIAGSVSYPAVVDVADLVVSTVSGDVSYPAIVDVNDLVVRAGLIKELGLSDSVGVSLSDSWGYSVV
jgi:hypothetical protein